MVRKELNREQIRELLEQNKSGTQIAKILKRRKKDVLAEIRKIKQIDQVDEEKRLLSIPKKYRTKQQKEIISKIDKKLSIRKKRLKEKKREKIIKIKERKKEDKKRLKEINEKHKGCNYNYSTPYNFGYRFEKSCSFIIYAEMSNSDLIDISKRIKDYVIILETKCKCKNLRMRYTSLEYQIEFYDQTIEESKISTPLQYEYGFTSFKRMINLIDDVIDALYKIVNVSHSGKVIEIYNIQYVNYDFKSSIR